MLSKSAIAVLVLAGGGLAEAADPRVRLHLRPGGEAVGGTLVGTLTGSDDSYLEVRPDRADRVVRVPRSAILRLEASQGRRSHPVAGLAIGAIVGLVLATNWQDACAASHCAENPGPGDAWPLVAVPASLGLLLGAGVRTEAWEDAPRLLVAIQPRRDGLALAVRVNR